MFCFNNGYPEWKFASKQNCTKNTNELTEDKSQSENETESNIPPILANVVVFFFLFIFMIFIANIIHISFYTPTSN